MSTHVGTKTALSPVDRASGQYRHRTVRAIYRAIQGANAGIQPIELGQGGLGAATAASCDRLGRPPAANRCRPLRPFFHRGANMSLNAISTAASATLPTVNFHSHGHRKGAHVDSSGTTSSTTGTTSTNASGIGQLPVGASTALFSNLLQSLEQTVAAQSAAGTAGAVGSVGSTGGTAAAGSTGSGVSSGSTGAAGSTGSTGAAGAAAAQVSTPGQQQELQAFMHSLFQALKQDGLDSSTGASAGGGPAVGAAAATSSGSAVTGPYQGNLVSSLQSLIQRLSPDGRTTAATSTLNATFKNLMNGVNRTGAAASSSASGGASSGASNAALQSFLNNFLQNLQANGLHALNSVGNSVNTNV
jgi:hypothetical protein